MPKKKLTEEEQEAIFNKWKETEEYQAIEEFLVERNNMLGKEAIEMGTTDISEDW